MNNFKNFYNHKNKNSALKDFESNLRLFLKNNFYNLIENDTLDKQQAMLLLRSIVSEAANKYGLTPPSSFVVRTNAEPSSPPMQPQAE
jgi:hypothetical protein